MAEMFDMYTGILKYRGIDFTFAFDKKELRLVPPKEKRYTVEWEWTKQEISPGVFTDADPIIVDESFLVGECNETNKRIIFIPTVGKTLGFYNAVVIVSIEAFIICKWDIDTVNKVFFSCPEINYIHPVNHAISYTLPASDSHNNGVISVSTPDFDATTTETQQFTFDGKEIRVHFDTSRTISGSIREPPLRLNSSLVFEFDDTNDYRFIYKLWLLARDFIRFLCYRKDVFIPTAELLSPYENGKRISFGTMYLIGQTGETDYDSLKHGRFIKQIRIAGHEGDILSDIAEGQLYLRHLPESYKLGRQITAARFVMITAAFEWEFHRTYPDGVKKSITTIEAEETVTKRIQELIDKTNGKQKKIYKFLKGLVKSDNLQAEIVQIGNDFSEIIRGIGNHLYDLNREKLDFAEMGKRLADQRNHFAHGDLNENFIDLSLLDLIFMEHIIYAMQLRYYKIDETAIKKAIIELFHLSIALSD